MITNYMIIYMLTWGGMITGWLTNQPLIVAIHAVLLTNMTLFQLKYR